MTIPSAASGEEKFVGYALPAGLYVASEMRRPRFSRTVGVWMAGIVVVALILVGVSLSVTKKAPRYMCPPECGAPPMGTPVTGLPRFTAANGSFSVSYPTANSAYEVSTADNGVTAKFTGGDTGVLQLFSEPANGRDPQTVARDLLKKKFPDAKIAYEIPNAMVGYQPGYGEVADTWPQGTSNSYIRLRTVLLVAIKNDLALVAGAVGPYHAFGPDFGPGLPSGANLQIAQDMGKYVNSFAWQGDPPR
ncbi:hypothetical protein Y900_012270 [Mycolicibacterium aromaticivorans JS19b1 = JCM 16368]|uniref:Uncharacterized protein n=1 Tax=Mycolicibacterium aromaticivorans JS19b1 = JCM 16368 TaxID=1440774 RepID=A0A064CJ30_9MYCO|nr:hypothetical protein [Mycolicibacterium aromaticivorans]KDE99691.1 hypothetical protein Y900_012270 [Mycolicibacterium aromaticivorans JS19b1 = JCM 16368]